MTLSAAQASPDDIRPGSESNIYPPTSTREANTIGRAPGHRGGWKNGSRSRIGNRIFHSLQLCDLRGRGLIDFISRGNYRLRS
jgi:hypothetical protein